MRLTDVDLRRLEILSRIGGSLHLKAKDVSRLLDGGYVRRVNTRRPYHYSVTEKGQDLLAGKEDSNG